MKEYQFVITIKQAKFCVDEELGYCVEYGTSGEVLHRASFTSTPEQACQRLRQRSADYSPFDHVATLSVSTLESDPKSAVDAIESIMDYRPIFNDTAGGPVHELHNLWKENHAGA